MLRGGDLFIRTLITDPLGNAIFIRASDTFGWYTEDHAKVSGKKIGLEICLLFS